MAIFANRAWLIDCWHDHVRIEIECGYIKKIEKNAIALGGDVSVDTLMPALANLHSHSFQRAMAGMTECRMAGKESFWTWRALMYQFLQYLTPDHIEAIAALAFMEMQEAGYASVGEFHYIHHQTGGGRYDNPAELSLRIMAAAAKTGIGLTHLPVLYTYGGAQKAELQGGQLRFGHNVGEFATLVDAVKAALCDMDADITIGIAPHSLRTTTPDELTLILSCYANGPVHLHIAEQPKEILEIQEWLGARPVEWMLTNHDVQANWCLVHATHMTDKETCDLAASGAVVGLCPITEANLGDGTFNGSKYLQANGVFGIGSDSNIRISLIEELRMLEYSQRLRDLNRAIMIKKAGSVGKSLYLGAALGGAQALARNAGSIEIGKLGDVVAIDSTHQQLCALDVDQLFDGLCFAADHSVITDVWSAGRHMVQDGRHVLRGEIISRYRSIMQELKDHLAR